MLGRFHQRRDHLDQDWFFARDDYGFGPFGEGFVVIKGRAKRFAKSKGAPELAVPAEVVVLEKLPMLGSGKVDQVDVTKLAKERAAEAEAA